tara:strand:+ start:2839 stop:3291 length:453 start_codon:yes stop_codon:yes gene_type:complete
MTKEVLLIEQVDGLGIEGDIVKVSDGYARNYLLPKGYASEVTEGLRRKVEKKRALRIEQLKKDQVIAEEVSKKIENINLEINVKIGQNEKMFGSVGISQLIDELKKKEIEIEKNNIKLHSPINELGDHEVVIKLHPEVEAVLKIKVAAEK